MLIALCLQVIGAITVGVLGLKLCWSLYFRLIVSPKKPLEYGKWAIITGSTSGIGADFADYLAEKGMSLLLVSRTEEKLKAQVKELSVKYNQRVEILAYDFTDMGHNRSIFYKLLDNACAEMHSNGG